jgi:murein DD-endopeptidase MepM/ murein hydrolase activator NlpD
MLGNYVKLAHPDGSETWYWHLMTDSVVVEPGDEVACGAVLGKVGSSGISSGPHLHFEVHDANGEVVDPYAGPYSQEDSLWAEQRGEDELPGWGCAAP